MDYENNYENNYESNNVESQQENGCPEGCCTGSEILCISIPCPISIVLLGLQLQLELPCVKLTSQQSLTSEQISRLLQVITNLLGSLGSIL
jgi:hypothetical protein